MLLAVDHIRGFTSKKLLFDEGVKMKKELVVKKSVQSSTKGSVVDSGIKVGGIQKIDITKTKNSKRAKTKKGEKPVIDNSFVTLLPKLEISRIEEESYVQRLEKDGVVIYVWKKTGIVLDGIYKFQLCKKYNIPYTIKYIELATKDEAIRWVYENAFHRHNLSRWYRSCAVIKHWKALYEKGAKDNQRLSKGRYKKGRKNSLKVFKKVDVNQRLAEKANVSRDTISKVLSILKNKKNAPKGLFAKLENEDISVTRAWHLVKSRIKKVNRDKDASVELSYINDLSKGVENNILCMDVIKGIKKIPDGSLSLNFTSPPFAVGKLYSGVDDNTPHKKHWEFLKKVFRELKPKFRKGGRCLIEYQSTRTREKEDQAIEYSRPVHALITNMMKDLGYLYHSTIIWEKGRVGNNPNTWGSFCSPSCPRIREMHSYIFVFSVGDWKLPCATGYSSELPFDEFDLYTKSIWRIPPETHKYGSHVCPFPIELPQRAIRLMTFENDLVSDIFGGSGTTAIAAIRNKRKFIHIDASETYCAEAKKRVEQEYKKLGIKNPAKRAA